MAYVKRYRAIVPVPQADAAAQNDLLLWLTRESFDRAATADVLTIIEFVDAGEMDPTGVPPKVEEQLGRPATEFVWRVFEGVGRRPDGWPDA